VRANGLTDQGDIAFLVCLKCAVAKMLDTVLSPPMHVL